jgi:twitching motility protein PilT
VTVPTLADLHMPPIVRELTLRPRGLVLVTGPTGSGKSTTLAAMVDEINETRACHIVTVEDPIEFIHAHKRAVINQREVGSDTRSFARALRSALRQDPDVILVGELRDLESIAIALTAAETGHLVFATLHTRSAAGAIDRIVDVFPHEQQAQVRVQLSASLQGIIAQALLVTADGEDRRAAVEVLVADDAVRNLIRQAKLEQVHSYMHTGSRRGMHTLEQDLARLVKGGVVTQTSALTNANDPEQLRRLLKRAPDDAALVA